MKMFLVVVAVFFLGLAMGSGLVKKTQNVASTISLQDTNTPVNLDEIKTGDQLSGQSKNIPLADKKIKKAAIAEQSLEHFLSGLDQENNLPLESVQPLEEVVYVPELSGEMNEEELVDMQQFAELHNSNASEFDIVENNNSNVNNSDAYLLEEVLPAALLEQEAKTPVYFGKTVVVD